MRIRTALVCLLPLLSAALLPASAGAQVFVYSDPALRAGGAPALKKLLVLPPEVSVYEITAGGVVEKVGDWSRQGRDNVAASLRRLAPRARFEIASLPELAEKDRTRIDEHAALYDVLAGNIWRNRMVADDIFAARAQSGFADYGIGPGLADLADRTGADALLIVFVHDFISTGERKALFAIGLLLGVGIPLGQTNAAAGLFDLRTGRLLWQSYDTSVTPDVRKPEDADKIVADLFAAFPGLAPASGR